MQLQPRMLNKKSEIILGILLLKNVRMKIKDIEDYLNNSNLSYKTELLNNLQRTLMNLKNAGYVIVIDGYYWLSTVKGREWYLEYQIYKASIIAKIF